ncbi:acyltransferase family protein [Ilumatobacter sp.]|uniref:acyltransferase family protein n=1 Tax=Ilumatobacter sp. TaxID=1967498 RepID=UPI003C6FCB2D
MGTEKADGRPWGYRPALDGLRAVAVFLVIAFHADLELFEGGFIGVDLFFVLSGFVVTNVIWLEFATTGRLELRRFYARRMRRLTPAAITCVVGTSVLFLLIVPLFARLSFVDDAKSALLYYANWNALANSTDYFEAATDPSPFIHFWSLSIEEQFYAFFPLLMIGLWRLARSQSRPWIIPAGLAVLIAGSIALQVYWNGRGTNLAYYRTDARLYQLLVGALLAIVIAQGHRLRVTARFHLLALAGLAALFVCASSAVDVTPSTRGFLATAAALAIVVGLELAPATLLDRVLSRPILTYLGGISYGIYLWHWPVILAFRRVLVIEPLTMFLLASTVAVGLAAASHRIIEQPVRKNKHFDTIPRTVVVTSLAITVVTALIIVPPILESRRTPRLVTSEAPAAAAAVAGSTSIAGFDDPVPTDIDYDAVRTFRAEYPECTVDDLAECSVRRGSGQHVLLIGDSIAQQYVPAFEMLAEENDWTLSLNIAQGCSWQMGLIPRSDLSAEYQQRCAAQRDPWYESAIEHLQPDVIVLAQLSRDDDRRFADLMVPVDEQLSDAPLARINATTIERTVEQLRTEVPHVAILEPIPIVPDFASPTECLSSASTVGACAYERTAPVESENSLRSLADEYDNVSSIDLDDLVCTEETVCMPLVDGVPVWRDSGHLTHFFVRHIAADLGDRLAQAGALDSN